MKTYLALVKRELQEHPALYVGPLGVNLFFALTALLLVARAIGSPENLRNIVDMLNLADERALEIGRNALFASPMWIVIVVTMVIGYFYFIDCLFAERRERTILFFKSFPVSDTQTVLSKVFCGLVVLPVLSLAAFAVTQLFVLVVVSAAIAAGGGAVGSVWNAASMLENWVFTLYVLLTSALWYSPLIAFFLLVSAWAKRAAFLWSLLPLFVIQAEYLLPGRNFVAPVIVGHITGYPAAAFNFVEITGALSDESFGDRMASVMPSPLSFTNMGGFLSEPALWLGMIVAGLFIAAAIYLRRYRDDS